MNLKILGLAVCLSLVVFTGCASIDYFSHLAKGQFTLLWDRQDVEDLLASEETPLKLKKRLELSQDLRAFAEVKLGLPVGEAYSEFTDLGRPHVVWNVYAAPALSLSSYTWCYPILGCMAYRGFYDETRAEKAAEQLKSEGYDVQVGGVNAYSTLGFFDDPLLNTFIYQNEVAFVELLIHEIAHRKLYIKDDTLFNENFASAVANLGAEQWYREAGDSSEFDSYQQHKNRFQIVLEFVLSFKTDLDAMFNDSKLTDEQKQANKTAYYQTMLEDFERLKEEKNLDSRYDNWLKKMNNASLATIANYQELVPGFMGLFKQQGGDWLAFYAEAERISALPKKQRHQALRDLSH